MLCPQKSSVSDGPDLAPRNNFIGIEGPHSHLRGLCRQKPDQFVVLGMFTVQRIVRSLSGAERVSLSRPTARTGPACLISNSDLVCDFTLEVKIVAKTTRKGTQMQASQEALSCLTTASELVSGTWGWPGWLQPPFQATHSCTRPLKDFHLRNITKE